MKRRNFLNWIRWRTTSDQVSSVFRKMEDVCFCMLICQVHSHWCDSIQCLAGAPALEVACDHSCGKMCVLFLKSFTDVVTWLNIVLVLTQLL
jgi:hypothetical protein